MGRIIKTKDCIMNNNNRAARAGIAQDTLDILARGFYELPDGQQVRIANEQTAAETATRHYQAHELVSLVHKPGSEKRNSRFEVSNQTTLAAARQLIDSGHRDVLCLNFASARNPGGGFLGGSEAQEENLAKSSGLYPCLLRQMAMYEANRQMKSCTYLDDMIYSPRVPVFRDDDYGYLPQPYLISMVTAPAVNRGAIVRNEPEILPGLEAIMLNRIAMLLALAREHGHSALVLGAWGCGVFGNQPADMARWFAVNLLGEGRFASAFDLVHFAVLDRREGGTYRAFADAFAGASAAE
jgi:uncharacterized protein (TIGR02452 family)